MDETVRAEVLERLGPLRWRARDRQGRTYLVRTLTPEDAPALQAAFLEQDPSDRMMRLRSAMARMPDRVARKFCTIDETRDVGLGLFPEQEPGRLAGGARVMRDGDGEPRGEFAVTVASHLHGAGLGRLALDLAISTAREIGIERVWGSISRRNDAMRALARSMGMREKPDPDDAGLVIAETVA